jgi:hypothetical protein
VARFKVKPPTEAKLSELQAQYLETRDLQHYTENPFYQEMFRELVPYVRSLTLKQTTGKIYLPPEVVEDAAIEATMKFMEQYRKPEFKAHSSFAGYLHFKILETLYSAKKVREDRVLSLNTTLEDSSSSNKTEVEELVARLNIRSVFSPEGGDKTTSDPSLYLFREEEDIIHSASSVLTDVFKSSASLIEAIKLAIGLLLFVRKTRFAKYQTSLNEKEREALDLCILELKRRLTEEID